MLVLVVPGGGGSRSRGTCGVRGIPGRTPPPPPTRIRAAPTDPHRLNKFRNEPK
nr:MAG TPA: hypothetical protein [Caudoviricetes sp.]